MGSSYGARQSLWLQIGALAIAAAASGCARSHDKGALVETGESELALLLKDGELLHIGTRIAGEQSTLSGYLVGGESFDPTSGAPRRFSELARRRGLIEKVICASGP